MAEISKSEKNIHAGNRERLRGKYLRVGMEGFEEHELLEMLLFNCFKQQDTNPLAHRLISSFGSLDGVLSASVSELKQVNGIGDNAAFFLYFTGELIRRGYKQQDERKPLNTSDKIANYLIPFYKNAKTECVVALALDQNLKVIRTIKVLDGCFDSAAFSISKVVRNMVSCGAVAVAISHNHPSNIALPSEQDLRTTERLKIALESVGIQFVDHIIVVTDDYVSLRQSGYNIYTIRG